MNEVDDVVKNGAGVDGKAHNKGTKKQNVTPMASPSELNDIPDRELQEQGSTLANAIRPSNFKLSESSAPIPTLSLTSSDAKSGSGWGTARASLKNRWDVDLYKGECRMPGEGIHAMN